MGGEAMKMMLLHDKYLKQILQIIEGFHKSKEEPVTETRSYKTKEQA